MLVKNSRPVRMHGTGEIGEKQLRLVRGRAALLASFHRHSVLDSMPTDLLK